MVVTAYSCSLSWMLDTLATGLCSRLEAAHTPSHAQCGRIGSWSLNHATLLSIWCNNLVICYLQALQQGLQRLTCQLLAYLQEGLSDGVACL
jgi:hypothetical protein